MFEVMMSIPGKFYLLHLIAHAAGQFSLSNVTVSAESVGGSTPGVRVTWKTTTPLECVTYVRVEFRASSRGPMVAIYATTNTSQTEIIQTGLQCATYYYITVVVARGNSYGIHSRQVQFIDGGKEIL